MKPGCRLIALFFFTVGKDKLNLISLVKRGKRGLLHVNFLGADFATVHKFCRPNDFVHKLCGPNDF